MLTDSEKKWLEERMWPVWDYFSCRTCKGMHESTMRCMFGRCPIMTGYYKDAAEFEARVAAKLARTFDGPEPCERGEIRHCPYESNGRRATITCKFCRLKHARLAVEQEMEAEGK